MYTIATITNKTSKNGFPYKVFMLENDRTHECAEYAVFSAGYAFKEGDKVDFAVVKEKSFGRFQWTFELRPAK